MYATLPPDSNDHDGGAAWRLASGARHRSWIRTSPAVGNHDRWRTDPVAGAHSFHHPSRLSLPRSHALVLESKTPHCSRRHFSCRQSRRLVSVPDTDYAHYWSYLQTRVSGLGFSKPQPAWRST